MEIHNVISSASHQPLLKIHAHTVIFNCGWMSKSMNYWALYMKWTFIAQFISNKCSERKSNVITASSFFISSKVPTTYCQFMMCRFTVNSCCCFSLSTGGYIIGLTDLFFHFVRFVYFQEFKFHADYRLFVESKYFFLFKINFTTFNKQIRLFTSSFHLFL